MDNMQTINRRHEMIVWGILLIWWGLRWSLLISMPEGSGLLGTGLILISLKAIRSLAGLPTNHFTTMLSIFALVSGGVLMAPDVLHLQFELPVFETLLIVLGVILLTGELLPVRKTGSEDMR